MFDSDAFTALMTRARDGDQAAAGELIRAYEPLIRREVRLRLEDQRLRRVLDSMDVCQSVLASFFVRTGLGEYDLNDSQQLIRLLVSMTRNKVASIARREYRQKRDRRRMEADDGNLAGVAGRRESPSQIVSDRELLQRARDLLPEDELGVAEMRSQGFTWEECAERFGGTAHACRVRFGRAVKRIIDQMGLGDENTTDE